MSFFKNDKADEEMHKNLIVGYFKNKIEGYERRDKDRETDEENYINEQWCLKHFHGCCTHCGVKSYIDMKAGKLSTNFTAQGLITHCATLLISALHTVRIVIVVLTDNCC